jgi:hypothetical protein
MLAVMMPPLASLPDDIAALKDRARGSRSVSVL